MSDALGDRMKSYENAYRLVLPKRLPIILRVDGKAFHTLTRQCKRPFDDRFLDSMGVAAMTLCEEIQGAQLAYFQSDEISVLVHGYKQFESQTWFDSQLQKMVSVSASIAGVAFSQEFLRHGYFDSRAFVLPEADVCNYFLWRQQDATRNSIQMVAHSLYSDNELFKKNTGDLQEMIFQKGINWNAYPVRYKRGRCITRESYDVDGAPRTRWTVDNSIPIFSQDRNYIEKHLECEQ